MSKRTMRVVANKLTKQYVSDINYVRDKQYYKRKQNKQLNQDIAKQEVPPPRIEVDKNQEIMAEYEDGKSIKELAIIFSLSVEDIKSVVRKYER